MEGDIVVVENQTAQEWRNVVITVNDHFRGGSPTLAPGGRLTAPLSGIAPVALSGVAKGGLPAVPLTAVVPG